MKFFNENHKMINETAEITNLESQNLKTQMINVHTTECANGYNLINNNNNRNNNHKSMNTFGKPSIESSKKYRTFDKSIDAEFKFPLNETVHLKDLKQNLRKHTIGKVFR